MTLWGKNNLHTTIITSYRPCPNKKGNNTVFLQQQRYFAAKGIETCPRQLWLDNICTLVKDKLDMGHQVILLADVNGNVTCKRISTWANHIGLQEVVSLTTTKDVPTHQSGSKPIDCIFCSHSLPPLQAG